MNRNPRILLVEDDVIFGNTMKQHLEAAGYRVEHCHDGVEAWQEFLRTRYDICLLDIVVPKMNGFELAKEIRKKNVLVPIFFLSSEKTLDEDRISGFQLGADGYIIKPFSYNELLKRIRVILKWTRPEKKELLIGHKFGRYTYHYRKLKIYDNDSKLVVARMSPIEAKMLRYFLNRPNIIVKKDEVLLRVWGKEDFYASRSMDVFIGRIRRQLKIEPKIELETVYNVGLRLNVPEMLIPEKITVPITNTVLS
ncbi:response regulator transcription factor [Chitinophaga nivalis]|uniref:Response regulator transcription factor n=1 Tax=Chitinophaga nivalis TaxID=2991709 RepID=A0ABT3IT34_9BACT|nr:response regulator transcription factor [Chitinophaga nivalis]MCW3463225.1 response regulator transcription factor [Chitinophaga nivalis]MCW3487085.1 response regulator transcription factor [Chitinophaga nivalis]